MDLFSTQTPNNVYVIIESVSVKTKPYNVIAVARSYDLALRYMGVNREVIGPLPLIGDDVIPFKTFQSTEPIVFDTHNWKGKPQFDFDKPALPKFDFNKHFDKSGFDFGFNNSFPNSDNNNWSKDYVNYEVNMDTSD